MRKALAILITGLMFLTGMRISIDHHYCGGELAARRLSLTGTAASCGMEDQKHSFSFQTEFGSICCEDQFASYGINNIFIPEYFRLTHPDGGKKVRFFQAPPPHLSPAVSDQTETAFRNKPPGEKPESEVSLSRICVLRI
ncbi:MAG TPA: hypothetical protein PLO24_03070 [Bacteroidales bacterium]|jgi:hypothetical protein|nr:hypothetical protein [Bacteroidales bacterium]HOS72445.1 hypothetical protein [Bacteroidales bacterium]HQH25127.1 hypothetical protein [Bacteroidales bacterium]HQJ83447.1 hypothetical protein [Bacteroidales bacterium]